jgi:hypothetical protein
LRMMTCTKSLNDRMRKPSIRIDCALGHEAYESPTAVGDRIEKGDSRCALCGEPMAIAEPDFSLTCPVCDDEYHVTDLDEASLVSGEGCAACEARAFGCIRLRVFDSWTYWWSIYDWRRNGRSTADLARPRRTDYWEGLVHFCNADEFIGIFDKRRLIASPTGYFGVPAVCLTEATRGKWDEIAAVHGGFGYVFRKGDVTRAGGQPIINMLEPLLNAQRALGFAPEVKPFVQLLRPRRNASGSKRMDFLHEREWRVPCDILLDVLRPFAVIIPQWRPEGSDWGKIIEAALEFEELSDD